MFHALSFVDFHTCIFVAPVIEGANGYTKATTNIVNFDVRLMIFNGLDDLLNQIKELINERVSYFFDQLFIHV